MLVQYQSCSLSPSDADLVRLHLENCEACRLELAFMQEAEKQLADLMEEKPSETFTDQVMLRLKEPSGTKMAEEKAPAGFWRPDLMNVLVASAATYLFLSTGVLKAVSLINPSDLEFHLAVKTAEVMDWIHQLNLPFHS